MEGRAHKLREACRYCAADGIAVQDGYLYERGAQDVVRCGRCNRAVYNAPRVETGKSVRTVTTVHNGVKPAQRARVLARDGRCVLCGTHADLHVGHLVPVVSGMAQGLTELELNHDENLAAMCAECNLGMGSTPVPLWIAVPILRARLRGAVG